MALHHPDTMLNKARKAQSAERRARAQSQSAEPERRAVTGRRREKIPHSCGTYGKPWLLPCDFDMRIRHGRLVTYQVPRTARWDVERNTAGIFIFSRCPLSSEFCLSIHSLSLSPVPVVGSLPGQFLCIASHRLLQSHSLALCLPRQPPANSCLASPSSPPPLPLH